MEIILQEYLETEVSSREFEAISELYIGKPRSCFGRFTQYTFRRHSGQ